VRLSVRQTWQRGRGTWQRLGARARRVAVVGVLAATAVGVLAAPGLESVRMALADGTAWLVRGTDVAHASSSTGEADWLLPDVVDEQAGGRARVGQDGDAALVVDPVGGQGYSIDAVTLELSDPVEVDASAVPLVGGGQAYLVSDGSIRWLDAATFQTERSIRVPGRVRATIDGDGILWAATPRDGKLRRVVRGEVTHEVRVTVPGHEVQVSLAGGRPVVHDTVSGELWFVDRRTGELGDPVVLPDGSVLQGPSPHGDRAWVAAPGRVLGVGPDGAAVEAPLPGGGTPHRPEVIDGRVAVPTQEGTLTVVDEESGELVTGQPRPLPAATNGDFLTFVKDGVLWFNAPAAEVAGTVAPDGTVEVIEVDEDGLRNRRQGRADDDTVNPNQVVTPPAASSPDTPRPGPVVPATASPPPSAGTVPPTPVQPPRVEPPPPSPSPAAPVTTTTTRPPATGPQTAPVPNLVDQNVDQACAALQRQGLVCIRQPSGQYAEPAQTVLSQNPQAGARVARGSPVAVDFHESAGVVVPQAGEHRGIACGPVQAAGLHCNLVPGRSANPVQPEGVFAQNPAPGTRVGPGATVNVTYDDRAWATLYQFDNPANDQLILSTDAGANGWRRTTLGRIFLEQAPGTVPVYCFEPNGAAGNQSNQYYPDDPALPSVNFRACGQPILGYAVGPQALTLNQVIVYSFSRYSERFYSLDPNDPIGVNDYQNRTEGSRDEGIFLIWGA
jgi:hypothetical protein